MTWDDMLEYCLAKPGAWQDQPWEDDIVVKVGAKIFAFMGTGEPEPVAARSSGGDGTTDKDGGSDKNFSIGLKCGPTRDVADEWLARYPADASVMAYIGRSGWNTLRAGGAIPDDELLEALDYSYATVVSKLPKRDRPEGVV